MITGKLSTRIRWLRWAFPLITALLVVVFQLGVVRWVDLTMGDRYRVIIEVLFYGTVGPVLSFLLLDILNRWFEERETSELQAKVLAQAREHADQSRDLSDDALQALFAASVLLASLKKNFPDLSAEAEPSLSEVEQALDLAVQQIRAHLQGRPAKTVVDRIRIEV